MYRLKRPRPNRGRNHKRPSTDTESMTLQEVLERAMEVFEMLRPVDEDLEQAGKPPLARRYFEMDVRNVLLRFGDAGDHMTETSCAAFLCFETSLHPDFSEVEWLRVYHSIAEENSKSGANRAPMTRPCSLAPAEEYDLRHGTERADAVCTVLMVLALFVSTDSGTVPAEKDALLQDFKTICGWTVVDDVGKVTRPSSLPIQ